MQPWSRLVAALLLSVAACGGDDDDDDVDAGSDVDASPLDELQARIAGLAHVVSLDEEDTDQEGYRYFVIGFDQPVDHDNAGGQHFTQYLTLIHRDETAPLVLGSTGYGNYYGDFPMEPTQLLSANQLIIEHRYFTPSRPDPTDWDFLRVVQAAADHHEIAVSFHALYTGAWVSTGGSKGGMTSIYHRHLYPDDVDGTVAYVAPYNQAAGDTRYDAWFDDVLPADCLQRVRDAQVDFLMNRRQALIDRATAQDADRGDITYTRVAIDAAVESAVAGVEWAFFQYTGVAGCETVPDAAASDDEAWDWLAAVNSVDSLSDESIAFFEPYYYQAYAELGYPRTEDTHLEGLLQFDAEDYTGSDPPVVPDYDPSAVDAAADWVRDEADDLILLYGEYDPWSGGMFDIGTNPGVARYVVAEGTHQSNLVDLPGAELGAAFTALEEWTGVEPFSLRTLSWMVRPPEAPHLPIRALSLRMRQPR